ATVLLLIFERVPIADAATLLDADTALVKKAQAIGLGEFSSNLAHRQRPTAPPSPSLVFAQAHTVFYGSTLRYRHCAHSALRPRSRAGPCIRQRSRSLHQC